MPKQRRLGFLLDSLGPKQLAYHLLYTEGWQDVEPIVFFQNAVHPLATPRFATMNISEAFSYTGTAIATDLSTAEKLLKFPGPKAKYFYVWDLEWFRGKHSNRNHYDYFANIYRNIPLIARSPSHKKVLEETWGVRVDRIIENALFYKETDLG